MAREAQPGDFGIQPLKAMLAEAEMTQAQAAEKIGVTTQTVTMILNGQARPSLVVAAQLAELVGRPIFEGLFTAKMLGTESRRRRPGTYKSEILRSGRGWRFRCECGTRGRWVDDRKEVERLAQQHRLRKHP